MPYWKSEFISMLIEIYKTYKRDGLSEPDSVTQFTKEYQKSSDSCMEFIDEHLIKTGNKNHKIQLSGIMEAYRKWYSDMYSAKCPGRKILKPYLEKHFDSKMQSFGWKGWQLNFNATAEGEDADDADDTDAEDAENAL